MVTKTKNIDFGGSTVFPGGLLDEGADSRMVEYLRIHRESYLNKHKFTYDDLLYRVNALRELYEETGILLARNITRNNDLEYPKYCNIPDINENNNSDLLSTLNEWREKVNKNAYEFENLCRSYNWYPDIESLIPWVKVQTPYTTKRRWDARFYLALIDNNNSNIQDYIDKLHFYARGKEISDIEWIEPKDIIKSHEKLSGDKFYYDKTNKINENSKEENKEENKNVKIYRIPPPTFVFIKEIYDIIYEKLDNGYNLINEWKYGYNNRIVRAIRPKMCFDFNKRNVILFWNQDYLYNKIDTYNELKIDEDDINNIKNKNIHRIYIRGSKGYLYRRSMNRIYKYRNISKL